ncbi:MAG TPA: HDIG domain-containing protein [Aggregatilineales bacterium]|nr:HDIG domain-containing protein [Anaerolineales bacterium]HRE47183.1 HDIG domain-containing protein [Aggregatilineales bacterium]
MFADQTVSLRRINTVILAAAFLLSAVLIVASPALIPTAGAGSAAGQVAPSDITAPISLTYESQVLTALARKNAADTVARVYDPPNPGVLREQVQYTRKLLDEINTTRLSSDISLDLGVIQLLRNTLVPLTETDYRALLALSDTAWTVVDAQVMTILERVMRNEIREDGVTAVVNNLPNLISFSVPQEHTDLIVKVVAALIRPNTFYNEERMAAAKTKAADAVKPVTRSFVAGQIVVRAGTIVSEADMEALTQLGLLRPDDQRVRIFGAAILSVFLLYILMLKYINIFHQELVNDQPRMALIGILFLIFLAGGRLFNGDAGILNHLYPAAAFTLIVAAFVELPIAAALTAALAAMMGVISGGSLEYAALVAGGGGAGLLALRHKEHLSAYFGAGVTIAVVNVSLTLLFGLLGRNADVSRTLALLPASLLSGVLSAGLGLVGLYLVSNMLNLPTGVKLIELSQPNQPLLQRLLREAPGTYQHSLQVANLAELAAERIEANAPLVRIGALYHDIGKLVAPPFFVENQAEGAVNPHDRLKPEESARIIINHVIDGVKMARKHHLPQAIVDFIAQHHGTTQVIYFYNKALQEMGGDETKVRAERFSYPGPRPQTREAAIMMLADASETIVRSRRCHDKDEIERVIADLIHTRLTCGQLEDSGLTVKDLRIIQEVFVSSLQGMFHPRIMYPTVTKNTTQEMRAVPLLSAAATDEAMP